MRIFYKKICLLLLSVLLISLTSHAEESGKPLAEKLKDGKITINSSVKGCDEDIKEHCDGLGNNAQKIFMCLAAYEDQLSLECKTGILEAAMSVRMGAAAIEYSIFACEADADKHCLDVEPGEGRLINCIKANESNVSQECVTALKETGLWEAGK